MVQNSGALCEPSMDEILTSIREIIEENAIQVDHFSNESATAGGPTDYSKAPPESIYEGASSVDDAMKALADRIGISSEDRDSSLMQVKDDANGGDGTVRANMQEVNFFSGERPSAHKEEKYDCEESAPRQENSAPDRVELSADCASAVEKIAKDILRPAIAKWLKGQLPVLIDEILREEVAKAVKNLP
ncbi:hypothetical protein BAnh1_07950 [Bartonella australis AUST/NH1]|uniref:DUF2497 domain-containing protein n=1 Tax=Bartonella australis (strain Aust/NH1) TaxID=1094489 RepID=M1N446_BARAA|nr:DUF2497 domain-containing protein [Bartonella australis]AGF74674.1 hypothetical protein BAnh1_07950 [Bartonella australis AUST/NH1]